MSELFMDILPDQTLDSYTVVLLGFRDGASPTIRRISPENLFGRLHTILGWPVEAINRIREEVAKGIRIVNVRLGSPTLEQLRGLGFEGLDASRR